MKRRDMLLGAAAVTVGGADRPDLGRRLAAVDPDNHHLYASLGCAAENLSIAAAARGKGGELHFDPDQDGRIQFAFGNGPPPPPDLFNAIAKRQSTRGDFDGRLVSSGDLQVLRAAVGAVRGVDLILITEPTMGCSPQPVAIPYFRPGLVRSRSTSCSLLEPRTTNTHDRSHPRQVSRSSPPRRMIANIGCAQAARECMRLRGYGVSHPLADYTDMARSADWNSLQQCGYSNAHGELRDGHTGLPSHLHHRRRTWR